MQQEKSIIQNRLLKDQIYEYIVELIKDGRVEPGQKLVEQTICDTLGVSRTPVREALTRLAAEGVIDKIPRRGFYVKTASEKDKSDSYIVQCALETLAGELYMEKCTDEQLNEQERLVNRMERALKKRNFTEYIQCNNDVHFSIINNCGNKVLINSINAIYSTPIPTYYEERDESVVPILEECLHEHRMLLQAFRDKDVDKMKRIYHEHIAVDKR